MLVAVDGEWAITVDEVEDVALPLYQGVMIWHLNYSAAVYESGAGNRVAWIEPDWRNKKITPQFLIRSEDMFDSPKFRNSPKVVYRRIAPSTNQRTMIPTVLNHFASGDSLFMYISENDALQTALTICGLLSTFTYDYQIRIRLGGSNLSEFIVSDTAIPTRKFFGKFWQQFYTLVACVCFSHEIWAQEWISVSQSLVGKAWKHLWAVTPSERLRIRCILDAIVAELYGLELAELYWILRECDHPVKKVCDKPFSRTLEPKAFWRVDKEKDPELRHTVLSLIAFHHLKQIGLEAFLNLNDGEGWMLPETLRLADYGLGHGDRAREHQPVAARLGDRFLPWQLEGTPEESWEECERHAENLRKLLGNQPAVINAALPTADSRSLNGDQQLTLLPNDIEQLNLFNLPDPE